jgi:hypothetical protein
VFAVAAVLFLALGPPSVVYDGEMGVPRSRARGISLKIERPTYVYAKYQTGEPASEVRAALMTAAGVKAYQEGGDYELLAATPYANHGEFRILVMRPGDYVVLIDNRHRSQAATKVQALVTTSEDPSLPGTLPAGRRHAITALSLATFAVIAGCSGWMLRRRNAFIR